MLKIRDNHWYTIQYINLCCRSQFVRQITLEDSICCIGQLLLAGLIYMNILAWRWETRKLKTKTKTRKNKKKQKDIYISHNSFFHRDKSKKKKKCFSICMCKDFFRKQIDILVRLLVRVTSRFHFILVLSCSRMHAAVETNHKTPGFLIKLMGF